MIPIPEVPDVIDPALAEEILQASYDRHRITLERLATQFGLDEPEARCAESIAAAVKGTTTISAENVDATFVMGLMIRLLAWAADNNFTVQTTPQQWAEWGVTDPALISLIIAAAKEQAVYHGRIADRIICAKFPGCSKCGTQRAHQMKCAALVVMREAMETEAELAERFGRVNVLRAMLGPVPAAPGGQEGGRQ